jgi:hypothetical protein
MISLPKTPYIHRIHMVLANPSLEHCGVCEGCVCGVRGKGCVCSAIALLCLEHCGVREVCVCGVRGKGCVCSAIALLCLEHCGVREVCVCGVRGKAGGGKGCACV